MEDKIEKYKSCVESTLEKKKPSEKVLTLGLISEIGSVQSCIKKNLRDKKEKDPIEESYKESLKIELGDVLWYINAICCEHKFKTSDVLLNNLERIKKDPNIIKNDYPNLEKIDISELKNISIPRSIRKFDEYQEAAIKTNLIEGSEFEILFDYCYLLNLIGHKIYNIFITNQTIDSDDLQNRLGDLYWYISALAKYYNITLDEIVECNMKKVTKLYSETQFKKLFDSDRKLAEQLPREMTVYFYNQNDEVSYIVINSIPLGDPLNDNSNEDDGYRYHDGIHFVIYAFLGWSPVWRGFLRRKRKTKTHEGDKTDAVEDGARAQIVEEMIVKLIHSYFENKEPIKKGSVDFSFLKTIEILSEDLEIKDITYADWEKVIIKSQEIYKKLWDLKGGKLIIDLENRDIQYEELLGDDKKFSFKKCD